MPNTKSAKKRHRQNLERRSRNRAVKSSLRSVIRKVREAVAAKNLDQAKLLLVDSYKALDQAAAKGVIHPNKAARTKSRLNHLIKQSAAA